jgi:hypothetical protein
MKTALEGQPPLDFANVVTLEQQALEHKVNVDTPDTAPETDEPAAPREKPAVPTTPTKTTPAPATTSGVPPGL